MGVLKEAQAQSNAKINVITEQVAALGQEDASRRLASTTTTVITTKSASSGETHVEGMPVTMGKTSTHVESSSHLESQRRS